MIGGGDPFYLKFWIKVTALERNRFEKALANGSSIKFKQRFDDNCYTPDCRHAYPQIQVTIPTMTSNRHAVSGLDRERQSVLPEVEATPTQPQP